MANKGINPKELDELVVNNNIPANKEALGLHSMAVPMGRIAAPFNRATDTGMQSKGLQAKAATAKAAARAYVDPSAINQSYYTTPTNASNYESGRPTYSQSDAVQQAAQQLAQHEQNKPGDYQSQYGDQIQALIDQMLNRDKFSYDFAADPLYQQYAEKYQQQGKRAMRDSMGEAAALTGGYGNSYAQTVGQQTYQGYLENLNDVIPELRDAAYQAYLNEGDTMRQNLGMLQTQDAADYGKYRDSVSDYQNELDYFYGKFSDMSQQEYNRYQNDVAAWEADRAYWYQRQQDQQAQADWQAEFNLALQQAAASRRRSGSGGGGNKKGNENAVTDAALVAGVTGLNAGAAAALAELMKKQKSTGGGGTWYAVER